MDPLINQNLENREETRAALTHKLESLELRLRESVENVKEAVKRSTDVPYQVNKRPWQMFGLSVAVGCAVGRLFGNGNAEVRPGDSRSKARPVSADNDTIRNADPYPQQLSVVKGATIGADGHDTERPGASGCANVFGAVGKLFQKQTNE